VNFQGVVMNVADLDRSIEFYREVLGFALLSQEEQLAVVSPHQSGRAEVIVLRAFGSSPLEGARHVGLRVFVLEAETTDEMEQIADRLQTRGDLVTRRDHTEWKAVVGRDPDGVTLVVSCHPGGGDTSEDGWKVLDDFLYGVGE
jgi:catechol-2,3-dioxygenase